MIDANFTLYNIFINISREREKKREFKLKG